MLKRVPLNSITLTAFLRATLKLTFNNSAFLCLFVYRFIALFFGRKFPVGHVLHNFYWRVAVAAITTHSHWTASKLTNDI